MADVPEHLKSLYQKLVSLPVSAPLPPWRRTIVHAVGGLTDVAFVDSSDLILVISSSGRGLFDCVSGERIARDPSEGFNHDTANLLVEGIGPTSGKTLRTAGLHGGGLAIGSQDGWSIDLMTLAWPTQFVFLTPPEYWIYGPTINRPLKSTKIAGESEVRACGFSPTGRAFILATSSDLSIFSRGA